MTLLSLISFFVAGIFTACVLLFLRRIALKIGLVDLPGGRKQHEGSVPLVGGIAILTGFLFTCLVLPSPLSEYKALFGCMTLMTFLGVADDLHELTPRFRLLGQMIIILLTIFWGHTELHYLGNLFFSGNIYLTWFAPIFTILATLSFINASNMLDGVDGLAGTVNAIQLTVLLWIAIYMGCQTETMLLATLLICLLVFLCFNFPWPLKNNHKKSYIIFMGDAGSLLLGFVAAWFSIHFSQLPHTSTTYLSPVTYLWITAIPLFDFFAVTINRIRRHISPMKGDRQHWHHWLQQKGLSSLVIVLLTASLSLLFALIGLTFAFAHISESYSLLTLIILLIMYVYYRGKK